MELQQDVPSSTHIQNSTIYPTSEKLVERAQPLSPRKQDSTIEAKISSIERLIFDQSDDEDDFLVDKHYRRSKTVTPQTSSPQQNDAKAEVESDVDDSEENIIVDVSVNAGDHYSYNSFYRHPGYSEFYQAPSNPYCLNDANKNLYDTVDLQQSTSVSFTQQNKINRNPYLYFSDPSFYNVNPQGVDSYPISGNRPYPQYSYNQQYFQPHARRPFYDVAAGNPYAAAQPSKRVKLEKVSASSPEYVIAHNADSPQSIEKSPSTTCDEQSEDHFTNKENKLKTLNKLGNTPAVKSNIAAFSSRVFKNYGLVTSINVGKEKDSKSIELKSLKSREEAIKSSTTINISISKKPFESSKIAPSKSSTDLSKRIEVLTSLTERLKQLIEKRSSTKDKTEVDASIKKIKSIMQNLNKGGDLLAYQATLLSEYGVAF